MPTLPSPTENATPKSLRDCLAPLLPELRARARRLARDAALAEDVLQDAVERALRFEAQFTPGTNLRAWMSRIVFSVFVSRCRRRRRERVALESLAADPCGWTARDPAPDFLELSPPTRRALLELPAPFRDVIELVDLGELSYQDAARELGVPLGTVMSRLHRARQRLAATLGPPAVAA